MDLTNFTLEEILLSAIKSEIEKENAEKFEAYNIEWPMMHIGP